MAGFQPAEQDVDSFLALVGNSVSRQEAINRLKGNNNNVEQALNEYFEDTTSNKYRWDEQQFASDREGVANVEIPSFNIQGADDPGPYAGQFDGTPGAPSRPPSRMSNNKSPHGKIIDLTAEHAAADPRTSMTQGEHQDRELEQAIAVSRAEAGLPPQESGITGTEQVHFGPATRSQYEYESGQWGMVPVGKSSAQEILFDPDPAERKRDLDAPAFLRPSVQDHRLGALLTIYHEIPLTRNLFLNKNDLLLNYGHDREWWAGKEIEVQSINGDYQELDRELQRLMAFLDNTERSYGSVEALLNHPDVKKERFSQPEVEAAVLTAWKKIFDPDNKGMVNQIFSAGVGNENEEDRPKFFAILDLRLPEKDSIFDTLYDVADEILWPGFEPLELEHSPYLSHIAEVIAFRIEGNEDNKAIDVPAVWYPDRYLKPARQAALEMRLKKHGISEELRQIFDLEGSLTLFPVRGKLVEVKSLFEASLKHDEAEIKDTDQAHDAEDVDMMSSQRPSKAATKLSAALRKVMASIERKLTAMNEQKQKAIDALRELSKLYTEPSSDPESPKLRKYTLRGVSTTKNTMYICRQAEPDLIEMDLDGDESEPKKDQWWRIHYAPFGSNPFSVEKTTEEKVLEAAKAESRNTLLVYASEKAMLTPNDRLPDILKTFVHFDNRYFKAEILENRPDSQTVDGDAPSVGISSPRKRKFDDLLLSQDPGSNGGVKVSEREVTLNDESGSSGTITHEEHEVLIGVDPITTGVDPSELMKNGDEMQEMQEMQERNGLSLLSRSVSNTAQSSTIDSMDLDQVVEDENVSKESEAVKHVGFTDEE